MDAVTGCLLPIEMIKTSDMWPLTLFGPVPHVSAPPLRLPHFVTQQPATVGQMEDGAQRGSSWHEWSPNSPHKGMVGLEPRQGSYKTPGSYEQGRF